MSEIRQAPDAANGDGHDLRRALNAADGNRPHTRRRGLSTVAFSCDECGAAVVHVVRDEDGTIWSLCPNDPEVLGL